MRAVVDTNVIVSALLRRSGPAGQVLDSILAGELTVLYDDRILGEYRDVLIRPKFQLFLPEVDAVVGFIEAFGEYWSGQRLDLLLPDETDLPFLEVATAGLADALITGNAKDFRPKKGRHDVKVISPAEFRGHPH
jgi:putative PIN family toxin of toxin-antitoxin system